MNPFNRVNDIPGEPFADMESEKTPMRVWETAGGEDTGSEEDKNLATNGFKSKGPNVGAPVNGTLDDDETLGGTVNDTHVTPPGGTRMNYPESIHGDRKTWSFESGKRVKYSVTQGRSGLSVFDKEENVNNVGLNVPLEPKVVKDSEHNIEYYG